MMSFAQWGNALYSGEKSYKIIPHRKIFVGVAGILSVVSIALIAILGINLSIDFTGGSQFSIPQAAQSNQQAAYDALKGVGVSTDVRVSNMGTNGLRVQTPALDTAKTAEAREALAKAYEVEENTVESNSIGPTWGQDVAKKAAQSVLIFVAIVALVMAVYFRSWTMSLAALLALFHDVLITVAFFAITRVEVSPATVIGFLTILAYSLYDTVVVFDKARELTKGVYDQRRYTYGELVNLAVNQTMVRSINTSVVAVLPVGAILFIGTWLLGSGTLTDISLALFVGMIAGAYSSIFIASPILVMLESRRKRTKDHDAQVAKVRAAKAGSGESADGEEAASMDVLVAPVKPGQHLGTQAQPKRKSRNKR